MDSPSPADLALYANHRRFLEAQRGAMTRHDGYDAIQGDIQPFQIALLNDASALEAAARARPTLFAPPWARAHGEAVTSLYQLTHMSLPLNARIGEATAQDIEIAATDEQIHDFTQVQAEGFASDSAEVPGLYDWFLQKNLRACREPDQAYYVLRNGGSAVAVLATVDSGDALGIYAVATPPHLRRRGLSTALLSTVCASTTAAGVKQICLQVLRGSDAERLYSKLGFEERFIVDVLKSNLYRD